MNSIKKKKIITLIFFKLNHLSINTIINSKEFFVYLTLLLFAIHL